MSNWSRFLVLAFLSAPAIAVVPPGTPASGTTAAACSAALAAGQSRASDNLDAVEQNVALVGVALRYFNDAIWNLLSADERTGLRALRQPTTELSEALTMLVSSLTEQAFHFDNATSRNDNFRLRAIAGITHDFRNLLTILLSRVSSLTRAASAQPTIYYDYEPIRRQLLILYELSLDANQLFTLMQDPTAIPVILGAKQQFPIAPFAVTLTNMLAGVQGKHKAVQVKVELNPKAAGLQVYGNQLVIRAAVMNLVKNAVEALQSTKKEQDTIGASGLVMVTISVNPLNQKEVVIVVADDGPGMPAHIVAGAMAPQGPATGVSTKGSQGVGLANVRSNVELNGGRMAIVVPEPEIGGTLVTLYLPTAVGQVVTTPAVAFSADSLMHLEPGSVLIVDDNRDVAESTSQLLDAMGIPNMVLPQPFEVVAAISGNKGKVSVVLLDKNGLVDGPAHSPVAVSAETVAARILAVDPSVAIFYYTGESPAAGYVYPDNVAGTLVKPVEPAKLIEQIQRFRSKP